MILDDRKRVIGKIVAVNTDKFTVELLSGTESFNVAGYDDMHYIAQLGGYVCIPLRAEYLIAEVIGLRDRETNTGHSNPAEQELAKIQAAKFLDVVPVGMLPRGPGPFKFGTSQFPLLYSDVLYIKAGELDRVFNVEQPVAPVEGAEGMTRLVTLEIGQSVIFHDYPLMLDIDRFFGSHVAILGNTGSGKSCTIASVLQALFEKQDYAASGATFIILDVNGEYLQALQGLQNPIVVRHLTFDEQGGSAFRLPHWFLNVDEWELLLKASERTQLPVLRTALGLSSLFAESDDRLRHTRNQILSACLMQIFGDETSPPHKRSRILGILATFQTAEINYGTVDHSLRISFGDWLNNTAFPTFIANLGPNVVDMNEDIVIPNYDNKPFQFHHLGDALDLALLYEESHGNRQIRDYCSAMLTRFAAIRDRPEFSFLRGNPADSCSMEQFVEELLGLQRDSASALRKRHQVIIIDMNSADDEVVEVSAAVLARLAFERLRAAEPRNRFPVNLVLEEAHRYVAHDIDRSFSRASRVFERIAKEGRKYGMFLIVSSQRPSEVSRTVLSQCGNFIVHRIQNPEDLAQIRQMTPHVSDTILRRLPSIPTQHALIFGSAVNLPASFRVRTASPRPKSDDNPISKNWFIHPEKTIHV